MTINFFEFSGYEIAPEAIAIQAKTMLLGGQTTELHMQDYPPFLPIVVYSSGFS